MSSPSPWALGRAKNALRAGVTSRDFESVAAALEAARREGIEEAAKLCDTAAVEPDDHESPHGAFIRMALLEAAAKKIREIP